MFYNDSDVRESRRGLTEPKQEPGYNHAYTTVIPAQAGIQCAAASRFNHCRLWNTGSPAFAG